VPGVEVHNGRQAQSCYAPHSRHLCRVHHANHIDNILSYWLYTDMKTQPTSDSAHAMSRLILEVFRLNGALLDAGDDLVSDIGLTSARWQVMGGIAFSDEPRPVAWVAQDMGLSRQAVQRIVNDLQKAGLVELRPNPRHARAKLVLLTQEGRRRLAQASERQAIWVEILAQGLKAADINKAVTSMKAASDRLLGEKSNRRSDSKT
jgi:DNA-binding MarR family transcriptional regulator